MADEVTQLVSEKLHHHLVPFGEKLKHNEHTILKDMCVNAPPTLTQWWR